jgi:hypothetical protein
MPKLNPLIPQHPDQRDIGSLLRSVDWSFSSIAKSSLIDCRRFHWYPATFIPEIPFSLMELLAPVPSRIYDPFAGIGTTLMQALLLGHEPYGTENSRVAVTVSQSLWTLLRPDTDFSGIAEEIRIIAAEYDSLTSYEDHFHADDPRRSLLPRWFSAKTARQVTYLAYKFDTASNEALRAALTLGVSNTLKGLSAQRGGWGCIADNMIPKAPGVEDEKDAFERLARSMGILTRGLLKFRLALPNHSRALLKTAEIKDHIRHTNLVTNDFLAIQDVDLIITSPPYPSMTDYATSQRLSYYWLGHTPESDLRGEIGARRKRFSHSALEDYLSDMTSALETLSRPVRVGGYVCLVLPEFEGDRTQDKARRRVVQEVLASLPGHGLILEHQLSRFLPGRRRHHNAHWTTLEREMIYVYRRSS